MPRVTIVLDPALALDPDAFCRVWAADEEAARVLSGPPSVVELPREGYHYDWLNGVVIPLATNLSSDALVALVLLVVKKVRHGDTTGVEVNELPAEDEDRIIAVSDEGPSGPARDDHRDRGAGE